MVDLMSGFSDAATDLETIPARPAALEMDANVYRPYLADLDITEGQKDEFLACVWAIMRSCAEMGFEREICEQIWKSPFIDSAVESVDIECFMDQE